MTNGIPAGASGSSTDWVVLWSRMTKTQQDELLERAKVTPVSMLTRPLWQRVMLVPYVFIRHYRLGRRYMPRGMSALWACRWVMLMLFHQRRGPWSRRRAAGP